MRALTRLVEVSDPLQVVRYVVNGLVSTAVHFSLLTFNLQIVGMSSAGLANVYAAIGGISVSYLGNRYFVFQRPVRPVFQQAASFALLYAAIALLHGSVLYVWTDVWRLDYRIGFLFATAMQVILSYLGNKLLVFKK